MVYDILQDSSYVFIHIDLILSSNLPFPNARLLNCSVTGVLCLNATRPNNASHPVGMYQLLRKCLGIANAEC